MKRHTRMRARSGLLAFLLLFLPAVCPAKTYTLDPAASRITFQARTSLHGFSGTAEGLEAHAEAEPSAHRLLSPATLRIPVANIKTGNISRDHALQYTLSADRDPEIVFEATDLSIGGDGCSSSCDAVLKGDLTVAGIRRGVELPSRLEFLPGKVLLSGNVRLALSQFDLKVPPLARVIGVKDPVDVSFKTEWKEGA